MQNGINVYQSPCCLKPNFNHTYYLSLLAYVTLWWGRGFVRQTK